MYKTRTELICFIDPIFRAFFTLLTLMISLFFDTETAMGVKVNYQADDATEYCKAVKE